MFPTIVMFGRIKEPVPGAGRAAGPMRTSSDAVPLPFQRITTRHVPRGEPGPAGCVKDVSAGEEPHV